MMDEDENITPRSGRKKKSTVARLAAKKRSPLADDYDLSGSVESMPRSNGQPRYKSNHFDPNVHINDQRVSDNSDEDVDQRNGYKTRPVPSNRTINRLQGISVAEDSYGSDDTEPGQQQRVNNRTAYLKGEKRYRDLNSDGDDLNYDNSGSISKYNGTKKKPNLSSNINDNGHSRKINVSASEQEYNLTEKRGQEHYRFSNSKHSSNHIESDEDNQREKDDTAELATTSDSLRMQQNSYNSLMQNLSNSDIDLRKHTTMKPGDYKSEPKRTVSLSQADMKADENEIEDSLGHMKSFGQPRISTLSPTLGHRTVPSTALGLPAGLERPMSGGLAGLGRRTTDLISERSYASTSAVPHMTTSQAKTRSYLLGSGVNEGALLGVEELERFFPDRQMRIYVGTWNMCEMKYIPQTLDEFIHPENLGEVCDMYVIGTQESCSNSREWELRLQESIGPHHVLIHSALFGVLYLMVFIRKDLMWYCSVTEESQCSTRAFSGFKTKGGVGVCVTLFGTSFLFINSHLSPHDGKTKERVEDYHKICRTLDLPKIVKNSQTDYTDPNDVTSRFDCVFWCGDMNWRILKEEDRVKQKIGGIQSQNMPTYGDLLQHDELTKVRNHELAFTKFQEGRIKFPPTYKYDIGTDNFDTSPKLRIPSYTDRILFRTKKKGAVTCLQYDCASKLKESDHRPVYGVYEANLRPGRDNIPLSAGQFNREVWLTAMRRRALKLDVLQSVKTQKESKVCSIQ